MKVTSSFSDKSDRLLVMDGMLGFTGRTKGNHN